MGFKNSGFLGQGLDNLTIFGSGRVLNGIESSGFSGQGLEETQKPEIKPRHNFHVEM